MARWSPVRDFALTLAMAVPGFLACVVVFVSIDPIAAGRWRPFVDDPAWSLALLTLSVYLVAGLIVTAASTDPDVAWVGCSLAGLFGLGMLLPIWIGLGRAAAARDPGFAVVLWLQPLLATVAFLAGAGLVGLARRVLLGERAWLTHHR